jgi:hypothetical protein
VGSPELESAAQPYSAKKKRASTASCPGSDVPQRHVGLGWCGLLRGRPIAPRPKTPRIVTDAQAFSTMRSQSAKESASTHGGAGRSAVHARQAWAPHARSKPVVYCTSPGCPRVVTEVRTKSRHCGTIQRCKQQACAFWVLRSVHIRSLYHSRNLTETYGTWRKLPLHKFYS